MFSLTMQTSDMNRSFRAYYYEYRSLAKIVIRFNCSVTIIGIYEWMICN